MAEKNEVLPGFVGPYKIRGPLSDGYVLQDAERHSVASGLPLSTADSLARILNSHAQCVEALKRVSTFSTTWDGSTSSAIGEMESIARSALAAHSRQNTDERQWQATTTL